MRLYIARHGETDYNRNRMMQGYNEIPLNERGIRQATLLAQRLTTEPLDRIVSSDLRRAVMTACIVASHAGLPIEYNAALRERDPGLLTGKSYDAEPRFFTDADYIPPAGEGVRAFRQRVRQAFEQLAADARHATECVVVITHGLVCHAFVCEFFGDDAAEGIGSRNTALTLAEYEDERWTLISRDCARHLSGDEPPRIVLTGA